MKIAIATLGCKVNQYESTKIINEMSANSNVEIVAFDEDAEIYFVNSCAVTSTADHKSRKLVSRARRRNPDSVIIALGCYGDMEPGALREAGADHIIKNSEKNELLGTLRDIGLIDTIPPKKDISRIGRTRGVIKVQDGCDQFCSYCVIPYLRGKPSSSIPKKVVDEIIRAETEGIKEIVITGIHLGKYGSDLIGEIDLSALLDMVLRESAMARIRLSSIEPFEVRDSLLELVASTSRVAKHLHIPLQSGSDNILRAMNRPYTRAQYMDVIDRVRSVSSEIAITTDVMVGFPGETNDDLCATIDLIDSIGFSKLHVFQYSERPLTTSSMFTDKVDADLKKERAKVIRDLGERISQKFAISQVDKEMSVVVEDRANDQYVRGKSGNYLDVLIRCKADISREIVNVKITGAAGERLFGELI